MASRHVLAALAVLGVASAGVAEEAAAPPAKTPSRVAPDDPYDRGTPRGAMVGFLEAARAADWPRAAEFLDLRAIDADRRGERGPELARQLKIVLDRTLWVDVDALSDEPQGTDGDGLRSHRDLAGRIEGTTPPTPIYLDRVKREDGVRIWKISASTVQAVPRLWGEYGDVALAEWLPESFLTVRFLEMQLWQWVGLLALVAVSALLGAALVSIGSRIFHPLVRRADALRASLAPLGFLLALAVFSAGKAALALSVPAAKAVGAAAHGATLVAIVWLAFRLVDAGERRISARMRGNGRAGETAVIVLARRTLKTLLAAIAFLAILQNAGVNVTGLLAGLGVGGIAVALAAQKSLENLFGGLTLVADQPVRVGDFCRFGDKVGTVEDIGLRSTRVRTLERTVVTIPNAEFATMAIENFARRDLFWFRPRLGLRYETTPDQIRWLLVSVREMLYAHPRVDPDPARIRFAGFGACSLDLDVFAYVRARDFDEFLAVAEDLNLRIMDLVAQAGTGFAFPSQTLYVRPDAGVDGDAAEQAAASVRGWREREELPLPAFPPERVRELAGSLDYPPNGSVSRRS